MEAKADLHTHTIHSDGALTPRELLGKAREVGISILSITDHDNVNGVDEALAIGTEMGVEIIPGAELSVMCNGTEIHILGYFLDVHSEFDCKIDGHLKIQFRNRRSGQAKLKRKWQIPSIQ